jgi:hypothetical protein
MAMAAALAFSMRRVLSDRGLFLEFSLAGPRTA